MNEFPWLRHGDHLPAVVAAQALLKRQGSSIAVDGDYGPRTVEAVGNFQRARNMGRDGVIGEQTWPRLCGPTDMQIIDCIDVWDPSLWELEQGSLSRSGARPIVLGGMCNGIEQAISMIVARANNLFLLRFHGHGAPGLAGASDGRGELEDHSSFQFDRPTQVAMARLRGCFGPYGCIQFMHCKTGSGAAGARFLRLIADTVGVPASGAYRDQLGGDLRTTIRYEGPVRTVCPRGASLAAWGASRPALPGMSIA
jgi:Putative peptidoglycan binding domain